MSPSPHRTKELKDHQEYIFQLRITLSSQGVPIKSLFQKASKADKSSELDICTLDLY